MSPVVGADPSECQQGQISGTPGWGEPPTLTHIFGEPMLNHFASSLFLIPGLDDKDNQGCLLGNSFKGQQILRLCCFGTESRQILHAAACVYFLPEQLRRAALCWGERGKTFTGPGAFRNEMAKTPEPSFSSFS